MRRHLPIPAPYSPPLNPTHEATNSETTSNISPIENGKQTGLIRKGSRGCDFTSWAHAAERLDSASIGDLVGGVLHIYEVSVAER